ncbi:MAG: nitroreductase [Planctomycetes bacterium]|nr:nitroreductase [Planctomycetota bacterium]
MSSTKRPPAILGPKPNRKACGVDVMDAIYGRRAVRAYDDWKLDVRTIEQLIDAAIHAPSARNEQPWSFAVVQDKALLRRLSERSKALWRERVLPGTPTDEPRAWFESPAHDVFHGASTLIVICARPSAWPANEDCCLAAQNLMLAAHGLGLATCPIGLVRAALNEPEFRRELGLPDDHAAVFAVVVGYPREAPEPPPRRPACILSWR